MEIGSPQWIQEQLQTLDELEQEREQLEGQLENHEDPALLRTTSMAIEALDEEIKTSTLSSNASRKKVTDGEEDDDERIRTAEFKREEFLETAASVEEIARAKSLRVHSLTLREKMFPLQL